MDQKLCPLCGKALIDEGEFCTSCIDIAQKQTLSFDKEEILFEEVKPKIEDVLDQQIEDQLKTDVPQQRKSNRKWYIFVVIACFVCVVIGGFGAYYIKKQGISQEKELDYWNGCVEKNTPLEYSKYLLLYPQGRFQKEAEAKILELREEESIAWSKLMQSVDINDYYTFLANYPATPHKEEIRNLMDSLSWIIAETGNTADGYLAYLENAKLGNITGSYNAMAQEKYDYMSQLQELSGGSLDSIRNVVEDVFIALSSNKLKNLDQLLASNLTNFYGLENKTGGQIINIIKADLKQKGIAKLIYTPDFKTLKVVRDKQGVYFVELGLNKEVVFSPKKKESSTHTAYLELNAQKRVKCLYEKKQPKKA